MGILNVTPDSFSDGGHYLDPGRAEEQALRLEAQGAALIDVGAESSRPGASPVSWQDECSRLLPVLERILPKLKIPVSVDTTKYEVVERVLDLGVSVINDISALQSDTRNAGRIARSHAGVVLMHMRGTPQTMQHDVAYTDLIAEVQYFLSQAVDRAREAGIAQDRILIDPGIGFGKSAEGNCLLLRHLREIKAWVGYPMLIGLSRKRFLRERLGAQTADEIRVAHALAHQSALLQGVDFFRVHAVRETLLDICMTRALEGC